MQENKSSTLQQFTPRVTAAKRLGCSVQLIDKWIREHRIRAFKLGRKVVIPESDLLRLLDENQIGGKQ